MVLAVVRGTGFPPLTFSAACPGLVSGLVLTAGRWAVRVR
jgi:hypothetical protein